MKRNNNLYLNVMEQKIERVAFPQIAFRQVAFRQVEY